jgi:hypothetical protein
LAEFKRQRLKAINPKRIIPVPKWNGMVSLFGHIDGDKNAEWPGGGEIPKRYLTKAKPRAGKRPPRKETGKNVTNENKPNEINDDDESGMKGNSEDELSSPEMNSDVSSAAQKSKTSSEEKSKTGTIVSTGKRKGSVQKTVISKQSRIAEEPEHPSQQLNTVKPNRSGSGRNNLKTEKLDRQVTVSIDRCSSESKAEKVAKSDSSKSDSSKAKSDSSKAKSDSSKAKSDRERNHNKVDSLPKKTTTESKVTSISPDDGKKCLKSSYIGNNSKGDVSGTQSRKRKDKDRQIETDSDSSDIEIYESPYDDCNYVSSDIGQKKGSLVVRIKKSELAPRVKRKIVREPSPDPSTLREERDVQVKRENDDEVKTYRVNIYDVSRDQQLEPEQPMPRFNDIETDLVKLAKGAVQRGLEYSEKEENAAKEKKANCENLLKSLEDSLKQLNTLTVKVEASVTDAKQLIEVKEGVKKKIATKINCMKDIAAKTTSALDLKEKKIREYGIQCDLDEMCQDDVRQKAFDDGVKATEQRLKISCSEGAAYQLGFKAGVASVKNRGELFNTSLPVQSQAPSAMPTPQFDLQKQFDELRSQFFRSVQFSAPINQNPPALLSSVQYQYGSNTNILPVGNPPHGMHPFANPPQGTFSNPPHIMQPFANPPQYQRSSQLQFSNQFSSHQPPHPSQQLQYDPSHVNQWPDNTTAYQMLSPDASNSCGSVNSSAGGLISPGYEGSGDTWGQNMASSRSVGGILNQDQNSRMTNNSETVSGNRSGSTTVGGGSDGASRAEETSTQLDKTLDDLVKVMLTYFYCYSCISAG